MLLFGNKYRNFRKQSLWFSFFGTKRKDKWKSCTMTSKASLWKCSLKIVFFSIGVEVFWSAFWSCRNKTSQPFCFNLLAFVWLPATTSPAEWRRLPLHCPLSHSVLFVLQFSSGEAMTLSLMHYAGFMHCHGSADLFICCGSFAGTFGP